MRVGFCPISYPEYPTAQGRIIIPVYQGGAYVGWQARYPHEGDPPGGSPKYYTVPGMRKSLVLYNYDLARAHPYVVICEGCCDVWSFGPEAVALFGHSLSAAQARLIGSAWGRGTVIILLDGDAPGPAQEAYNALAGLVRQTVVVALPADRDPGGLPRQELRQLVFAEALRQGADLGAAVR
jgi:DNA primase